jgi:hypothetical protein
MFDLCNDIWGPECNLEHDCRISSSLLYVRRLFLRLLAS